MPVADGGTSVFVAAPPLADGDVQVDRRDGCPAHPSACCSGAACWTTPWSKSSASQSTRIDDDDRAGLERLIRYATRPPLAAGRLQITDDDQLTFRLKTPWSDGTTHLLLAPLALIEKLAALVPPRRRRRAYLDDVAQLAWLSWQSPQPSCRRRRVTPLMQRKTVHLRCPVGYSVPGFIPRNGPFQIR